MGFGALVMDDEMSMSLLHVKCSRMRHGCVFRLVLHLHYKRLRTASNVRRRAINRSMPNDAPLQPLVKEEWANDNLPILTMHRWVPDNEPQADVGELPPPNLFPRTKTAIIGFTRVECLWLADWHLTTINIHPIVFAMDGNAQAFKADCLVHWTESENACKVFMRSDGTRLPALWRVGKCNCASGMRCMLQSTRVSCNSLTDDYCWYNKAGCMSNARQMVLAALWSVRGCTRGMQSWLTFTAPLGKGSCRDQSAQTEKEATFTSSAFTAWWRLMRTGGGAGRAA
ncbi:hypothetical protein BC831DRAFT_442963, partial [Entophlyctis helioformis]